MKTMHFVPAVLLAALFGSVVGSSVGWAQTVNLPTSKQLLGVTPGGPQRLNSLPISMTVSPDGRYIVTVNAGFGVYESQYRQSLAVLDTQNGRVTDFPDERTMVGAQQSLYSGLAFSRDGKHLYASIASLRAELQENG